MLSTLVYLLELSVSISLFLILSIFIYEMCEFHAPVIKGPLLLPETSCNGGSVSDKVDNTRTLQDIGNGKLIMKSKEIKFNLPDIPKYDQTRRVETFQNKIQSKSQDSLQPTLIEPPNFVEETSKHSSSVKEEPENELLTERNEVNDFIEDVVCQESDLKDNEMKVCDLGNDGGKVLVVKQNGQINAIGTKCSHYGAPLASGALSEGRVRCPWHGACFNIKTGDIEDFPGLDSIPCYNVEVTPTGGVKVKARAADLKANKRLKMMSSRDTKNNNVFVVVGGGAAGLVCSETLRQEGYTGKLLLVTAEKFLPYDRIKLSKQLDLVASKIQLRSDSFYKEHDIDVMLDTKVTGLDTEKKCIITASGQTIIYTSLFVATGATPRTLSVPGSNLRNIFTLRSLSDANEIAGVLNQDLHVVIYGSSFIGMEVAAYCVGKVSKVTVVGRNRVPFIESLGETVGRRIERLFKEKGVDLKMETTVESFEGNEKVENVKLSDGTSLKADVVILGIGSNYATGFLKDSGIKLNQNGSIPVNKFLETNIGGIYAGGDIAEAPVFAIDNESKSIGHWGLAHYHGKIAALNMMSNATPLKTIPFFWTMLFGVGFRYAGFGSGYDHTFNDGDLDGLKFAAYYCKGDKVVAVTTVGVDPLAAQFAELLYSGKTLSRAEAESKPLTWYKNQ